MERIPRWSHDYSNRKHKWSFKARSQFILNQMELVYDCVQSHEEFVEECMGWIMKLYPVAADRYKFGGTPEWQEISKLRNLIAEKFGYRRQGDE